MQTAWVRTGNERYLRMTKFWGKLFLINFALGVVTGIVQEFQFGMNWSDYSRFVGDIFGAPLAIEGLLAFFLESTFLGLWIFGWDRLPKKLHLACIWLAVDRHPALGLLHPRRELVDAAPRRIGREHRTRAGRAARTSGRCSPTRPRSARSRTPSRRAFVTAGMFIVGISAWHLARGTHIDGVPPFVAAGPGDGADRRHRRGVHR